MKREDAASESSVGRPAVVVRVNDTHVSLEVPRQAAHYLALLLHSVGALDEQTDWRHLAELRDRLDHELVRPPGAVWKVRRWEKMET